jgi:hypothetical protein
MVKAAKEDPAIHETTFARATNLVQLKEALVPSVSTNPYPNVVLACLTNPLTNHPFDEYKTMVNHCNQVFAQVLAWIEEGRGAVPGTLRQVCFFTIVAFCHVCKNRSIFFVVLKCTILLFMRLRYAPIVSSEGRTVTPQYTTIYVGPFQVFVVPPLPRSSPFWYRRYYHPITTLFAEAFRHTEDGIHVLPTYAKPEYEVDGIHLTEESGPR